MDRHGPVLGLPGRVTRRAVHVGLVPEYECYGACSDGWRTTSTAAAEALIATGKGSPNVGEASPPASSRSAAAVPQTCLFWNRHARMKP